MGQPLAVNVSNSPTVVVSGTVPVAFNQPITVSTTGTQDVVIRNQPVQVTVGNAVSVSGTVPVQFTQPITVTGTVVSAAPGNIVPFGVASTGSNRYSYSTSSIGKKASVTFNSSQISDGVTGYMMGIIMSRSVDTKFEVQTVKNNVATTVATYLSSSTDRTKELRPHQYIYTIASLAGQTDNWRVVATDVGDTVADAYVTFEWFEA